MERKGLGKKRMSGVAAVLAVGTLLLGGCAQQNVNVNPGGDTQIGTDAQQGTESGTEGGRKGLEQFKKLGKWEEKIAVKMSDGTSCTLDFNAVVKVPDGERMSVVEVCYENFDEEYKKQICTTLFGGKIYQYGYAYQTKEELEQELYKHEEDLQDRRDSIQYQINSGASQEYIKILERKAAVIEEEIEIIRQALREGPKEDTPAEDFAGDSYWGYIDGVAYTLEFERDDEYSEDIVRLNLKDAKELCPEELKSMDRVNWTDYDKLEEKNQSSLTKEETREKADLLLEKLGMENLVAVETHEVGWNGFLDGAGGAETEDDLAILGENWFFVAEGYQYKYEQKVDEVKILDYGTLFDYEGYFSPETYVSTRSMKTQAWVAMKEEQVVQVRLVNPLHITKFTEDVLLLPLDTIQSIVRGQAAEGVQMLEELKEGKPADGIWKFDRMELIYLRIKDPKRTGYYSYVPVWRFSKGVGFLENALFINAIDGTWIRLLDVL